MSIDKATDPARAAIGERLAEARAERSMGQRELANAVGKSLRSVASWEAGESMPDADALAAADRVGIDVLYVITGRRGGQLSEQQSLLVSYTSGMPGRAMAATLMTAQVLGEYAVPGRDRPDEAERTGGATLTFHGDVTQAIGGNLVTQHNVLHAMEKDAATPQRRPRK
jgi:transcriptional regulator with XRE-family HTH domain